jgi:hypothetical protein
MLRPRKNPLVDGPLLVGSPSRLRLWRLISLLLGGVVIALVFFWPKMQASKNEIPDEVWWRRLVSRIALQRLVKNVDASAVDEMRQKLAQSEAERVSLSERLAEAGKMLEIDRSKQRLSQVVARKDGGAITFELLLRTPNGESPGTRLSIQVMAINDPSSGKSSTRTSTLALDVVRSTRLAVAAPKVAETLQGRIPSGASHLLVMLTPAGDTTQTEALMVPVEGNN